VSTNSASEAKRPIGLHPCAQHESRIGSAFQADANVALLTDSVMPPPAAPPKCLCGQPAEWARSRWWCAVGEAGCGYEAVPPPTQLVSTAASLHGVEPGGWRQVSTMLTPTCACGLQAVWTHHGHWFCVRGLGTGCGFVSAAEPPRPEPQRIEPFEAQASITRGVAAMLTAAAYGPLGAFTFIGVADCGRGLFARQALPKETIVGEYGGPRLHMASLRKGEYALQVPGTRYFIDGNWDNSPYSDGPRHVAIYCNHSSEPNARLERRVVPSAGPYDLRYHLLVITNELVPAGAEIRIDYERGSRPNYWQGSPPQETSWRQLRLASPPPSGIALLSAACTPRLPLLPNGAQGRGQGDQVPPDSLVEADESPIPWDGPQGGDARLTELADQLHAHKNPSHWALVATHLPGRTAQECRRRFIHMASQQAAHRETRPAPARLSPRDSHPQPSHPQPSHPQPSHPQPSHPQPSHPQPSHPQPSHPQPSHPQPSHPQPSHPSMISTSPPRREIESTFNGQVALTMPEAGGGVVGTGAPATSAQPRMMGGGSLGPIDEKPPARKRKVMVPEGARPGSRIYHIENGIRFAIVVPPNARPGQRLKFHLPQPP